jgi:competence protein ComEC
MRKSISNITKLSAGSKLALAIIAAVVCVSFILGMTGKWHDIYVFFGLSENISFASGENASVHFIDVGQGDSALILTAESSVLIDSGEREYAAAVINYLRTQGVVSLCYIIVSHPHSDHMGGMSFIIDELGADYIITPHIQESLIPNTTAFTRLSGSIEDSGAEVIRAEPGMVFKLCCCSQMEILAPLMQYNNLNDNSVVARFSHAAGSFLFTGDIEAAAESDLADTAYIKADVLAVAHHGSNSSSTARFLNAVGGRFAIISVGSPNSYNHPRGEVLSRLELRGYEILRTDLHGNIVFELSDDGFVIKTENESYEKIGVLSY